MEYAILKLTERRVEIVDEDEKRIYTKHPDENSIQSWVKSTLEKNDKEVYLI